MTLKENIFTFFKNIAIFSRLSYKIYLLEKDSKTLNEQNQEQLIKIQKLCNESETSEERKPLKHDNQLYEDNQRYLKTIEQLKYQIEKLKNPSPTPLNLSEQENYKLSKEIMNYPGKCFLPSSSFMTPTESRIYFMLKAHFEKLTKVENKEYHVFPQVCLHSFINRNPKDTELMFKQMSHSLNHNISLLEKAVTQKYRSKSIDFLICLCSPAKTDYNGSPWYSYRPILGIEIDGTSHYATEKHGITFVSAQKYRDNDKSKIFGQLEIPLIRYRLWENQLTQGDYPNIKRLIEKELG